MSFVVTQYDHHVQEEKDTQDAIKDPELEGQFQDSIAAHKPKRNIRKSTRFSDMVVSYTLPVESWKIVFYIHLEKQS